MKELAIPLRGVCLGGELEIPSNARSLVVFAHGSGSSRHSPRNQFVARALRQAGLGTFLFDLLTEDEEQAEAQTRRVTAPTLLIVGGEDRPVIPLNEDACSRLRCEKALRIVPGASHLFEEPGKLEIVGGMAAEWFTDHLQPVVEPGRLRV